MSEPKIAALQARSAHPRARHLLLVRLRRLGPQPFCDGSHKGTGLAPQKFEITETTKVALCNCKHSGTKPFCDGTHKGSDPEPAIRPPAFRLDWGFYAALRRRVLPMNHPLTPETSDVPLAPGMRLAHSRRERLSPEAVAEIQARSPASTPTGSPQPCRPCTSPRRNSGSSAWPP